MIIVLSGKRKSGKDTLAGILQEKYSYIPCSLAAPLKVMCRNEFGLTKEQTDGEFKEFPTHYIDYSAIEFPSYLTPRDIMIRMGQFYRSINPHYWIDKLTRIIDNGLPQDVFVITDVRFMNELVAFMAKKALTVRLERSEVYTGTRIQDKSETDLDGYDEWDLHIPEKENCILEDLNKVADKIHSLVEVRKSVKSVRSI